jgi:hypothetical protein
MSIKDCQPFVVALAVFSIPIAVRAGVPVLVAKAKAGTRKIPLIQGISRIS